jgi:hypothetical protein
MHWCGVVAKVKHKLYQLYLLRVPSGRVPPSRIDVRSQTPYCTPDPHSIFVHEEERTVDAVLDVGCFLVCTNLSHDT